MTTAPQLQHRHRRWNSLCEHCRPEYGHGCVRSYVEHQRLPNKASGKAAHYNNATGSTNTAISQGAGFNQTTGSGNVYIGTSPVGPFLAGVQTSSSNWLLGFINLQKIRRNLTSLPNRLVLVRLDHVASCIVNANHGIMRAASLWVADCIADCVWLTVPQPARMAVHRKLDRCHACRRVVET